MHNILFYTICIDNLLFNGGKRKLSMLLFCGHTISCLGSVWLFSHNWPLSATFLDEVVLSVCHTVVPIPTAKWTFSSKHQKRQLLDIQHSHANVAKKYNIVPFHLTFLFSETLAFSRHEMHLPLNEVWRRRNKNRRLSYILQICHLTLGRKVALVLH